MAIGTRPAYVRIAELLHNRIQNGETGDAPPSVRKVASQFGVSSVTASRALQLLETRLTGFAGEQQVENAKQLPERWAVCLHVSPGPHQHATAQLTADGFRMLARDGEVSFDFDAIRLKEGVSQKRIDAVVAAAAEKGTHGLFFLPSRVSDEAMRCDEALLAACAAANMPVVLMERRLRGQDRELAHDLVCFHDFEGGRLLTKHLVEQGRRRIAFMIGSPTSSHIERLAGYFSFLHSAGIDCRLVLDHSATVDVGAAYKKFVDQMIESETDAVICYHEYAALGLIMELLRRGKSVPDDTAVAAFYGLGLGENFSIGITTYDYPAKTAAARALDVMRWRIKSPDAPPTKVVVPGELIARNSTIGQPDA